MRIQPYVMLTIVIATSTMTTEKFPNNNAAINVNINVQSANTPANSTSFPIPGAHTLQRTPQSLDQLVEFLKGSIKNSITPLSLLTLTGIYALLWIDLYHTRKLINNPESWCTWKQHCTVDYLAQQQRNEVCDPLLLAIQERYMNLEDPTNCTTPIASFLPALSQELHRLERYCYWAKRLISWRCAFFFPVDKKSYEKAQEAITRLRFMKKIFIQWWATHNTQQHLQPEAIPTRYRAMS